MNKKHSAAMLVIALSLLAFAFALPKASFATNNVAEGNVAVEDAVDNGSEDFEFNEKYRDAVEVTKEKY